jgi:hypothetical protein
MLSVINSELGYCNDIKTTLPPFFNHGETNVSPMSGFPEPPGPVITVVDSIGNPSGINSSTQFISAFIVFIL